MTLPFLSRGWSEPKLRRMIDDRVKQQEHGYRNGHQLLSASLKLPRDDQDAVDRLSDMAGPLRPGETFSPYLTAYPLPSRSHYVLARTWQDITAPRAGCVLTRSLLVPMPLWETIESLDELLALLIPIEQEGKVSSVVSMHVSKPPPIVQDHRAVELMEAMFLEGRQPIVFFEAPEAEAMTVRVLTALWPSIRRNFSACTFALAPRKIDGRDFDLVFAPKSARTRFADWPGRRIDVSSSNEPRHRWSASTAKQIFQSDHPSLTASDALGVLKRDARGDESALRLSLLWNELAIKAEEAPTAVLGMLDILNSQHECAPDAFERLSPVITRAADVASSILPDLETWRFLTTLIGKFPVRLPPKPVLRKIKQLAANLANRNPEAALEFLEAESHVARTVPFVMLAGMGDGLGPTLEDFPDSLPRLPNDIGLGLISMSTGFARSVMTMAKHEPSRWIPRLIRLIETPDRELKRKARRNLAPLFDDGAFAPLLSTVLDGVTSKELASFVVRLGRVTNFEVSAFDEPLVNAARDDASLGALRKAVATHFSSPAADRFLFSMLHLTKEDITWLCSGVLDEDRARRLLLQILETAPDRSIQAVQRDAATREKTLGVLLGEPALCAAQIARILALVELRIEAFLEIGLYLLPLLKHGESKRLGGILLERALAEAAQGDQRVPIIVSQVGSWVDPRQLIRMAVSTTTPPGRVGDNVIALGAAPEEVRRDIVSHIDDLSERLLHHGQENLGEAAYVAWASMIVDAGAVDRDAQLRAAMPTLTFALGLSKFPVSTLITVVFPLVYARLLKSKGDEDFKLIPALLALPLSFFSDWDRAKSARRDLVEAFLKSSWPPANLLLTAIEAGIEQKIIKRLIRSYGGNQYLAAIEQDSHRLEGSTRLRVQESLSSFRLNQTSDDWD